MKSEILDYYSTNQLSGDKKALLNPSNGSQVYDPRKEKAKAFFHSRERARSQNNSAVNSAQKVPELRDKFMQDSSKKQTIQHTVKDFIDTNKGVSDAVLQTTWEAFGRLVKRKLEEAKGVKVPRFGTITSVTLDTDVTGTTMSKEISARAPVFLVSKDFHNQLQQAIVLPQFGNQLQKFD